MIVRGYPAVNTLVAALLEYYTIQPHSEGMEFELGDLMVFALVSIY